MSICHLRKVSVQIYLSHLSNFAQLQRHSFQISQDSVRETEPLGMRDILQEFHLKSGESLELKVYKVKLEIQRVTNWSSKALEQVGKSKLPWNSKKPSQSSSQCRTIKGEPVGRCMGLGGFCISATTVAHRQVSFGWSRASSQEHGRGAKQRRISPHLCAMDNPVSVCHHI